ncbi:nitroreductase family deazaflavin-dependent oxidoreductase [Actinospongicola halichondriae]|uniref:nitroreductase family deazaflavin-dependent oxidoreductase n=1 Tax=Actinospongicola halichondriae TaxID=3236844 RepID=UPI003D46144C
MSAVKDAIAKGFNVFHRTLYDLSKGKVGGTGLGMPVLKLTTTGAKSGQKRTVMLTSPIEVDGNPVIVASYGGDDRSPAWFHNLKADPACEVTIHGQTTTMTARIPDSVERDDLWMRLTEKHDNYAGYQTKTDRTIPVVVLES